MITTASSARPQAFPLTRWSIVLSAGRNDTPKAQAALAELCRTYWYPLYAYVRRRGHAPHDAQDLTQEFFTRLIDKQKLEGLVRDKGKFRSFLLTALNHFLCDEWRSGQTQKRGEHQIISLDAESAEHRYKLEPVESQTAEIVFERQWALTLLNTVFSRLQAEYEAAGKGELFAALNFALTGERNALPYGEMAAQLAMSEGAVRVAVHRLRQRYRQILRAETAQTIDSVDDVEAELHDLFAALAR